MEKLRKKHEVWKEIGIKKGDVIADWIIPYDQPFPDLEVAIHYAKLAVDKKFKDAGIVPDCIDVFQNVEVTKGVCGVYVIGVHKQES